VVENMAAAWIVESMLPIASSLSRSILARTGKSAGRNEKTRLGEIEREEVDRPTIPLQVISSDDPLNTEIVRLFNLGA
jgi:hypothetical protein